MKYGNYVIKCIKDDIRNHKRGQYTTSCGYGTFDINKAKIYSNNDENDINYDLNEWNSWAGGHTDSFAAVRVKRVISEIR